METPDYMQLPIEYRGGNERCTACETDRILLKGGGLMCPICDNPARGEATWFTQWGNEGPPEG